MIVVDATVWLHRRDAGLRLGRHWAAQRRAFILNGMADERERRTIHYAGHVQGVGFRYNVNAIAQHHAVSGFVQNLADGRVVLVAEGTRAALNAFCGEVRERMGEHIRQELTDTSACTAEFAGFAIRH